jgi:16S rRNA (guanine527-N7)-methyltransferase
MNSPPGAEAGRWECRHDEATEMSREICSDEERFERALTRAIADLGNRVPSAPQLKKLSLHYSMLCKWNQRTNLTRIVEPSEAARLHYAESLFGAKFIGDSRSLLDIGSGAGFPAVPLAVIRPDLDVTALEANQKKSLFLLEIKDALDLANLSVLRARLEDFDWHRYQLLTSRAIDRAEEILPAIISRLSVGQRLMLYCANRLLSALERRAGHSLHPVVHPIPESENRLIALFGRCDPQN